MATVFVTIPTYNETVHIGTMMGMLTATAKHKCKVGVNGSSLLAHGFNRLWVQAVASECDYFAMCHADIGPSAGWLDVLIDELETHDADLMSAVVPVKTTESVYSTAMCQVGQIPTYRLTHEHLQELPDTFGTDDVLRVSGEDGLLCCNTGLWACRLKQHWTQHDGFNIHSWIDWETGRAMVMPEDWAFSMQLHGLGLKVMATKKIPLIHAGQHTWRCGYAEASCQAVQPV